MMMLTLAIPSESTGISQCPADNAAGSLQLKYCLMYVSFTFLSAVLESNLIPFCSASADRFQEVELHPIDIN